MRSAMWTPRVLVGSIIGAVLVVLLAFYLITTQQKAQIEARGLIAFVTRDEAADDQDIYVMQVDGSNLRNITNTPTVEESDPAWSPDGTRLAFASDQAGESQIYVMSADGSNVQPLTSLKGSSSAPAWSPDGTQIAFVSINEDFNPYSRNIYIMNADGSDVHMLLETRDEDGAPGWSPDGTQLVFQSGYFQQENVYVVNADGTDMHVLMQAAGRDLGPRWSPTGRWILFFSTRNAQGDLYKTDLFATDLEKKDDFRLTYGFEKAIDGAWSPDGEYIVYAGSQDGHDLDIFVRNFDDMRDQKQIMNDDLNNFSPAWQPVPAQQ